MDFPLLVLVKTENRLAREAACPRKGNRIHSRSLEPCLYQENNCTLEECRFLGNSPSHSWPETNRP